MIAALHMWLYVFRIGVARAAAPSRYFYSAARCTICRDTGHLFPIGWINLASTVPYIASYMYASNVTAFILHLMKNGKLHLDSEDEIIHDILMSQGSEVVNTRVRALIGDV